MLIPELIKIEEAPIFSDEGDLLGWHASTFTAQGVMGGGLNRDISTARRIALAESIERISFRQICNSSERSNFLIDDFPTSCGFSAGFELQKTRKRSLAEAIERWAWSKWIDEQTHVFEIQVAKRSQTKLTNYFLSNFEEARFFKVQINTTNIPDFFPTVEFGVVIGIKNGGIFPGSRVSPISSDLWEHCALEAWRHLDIFEKKKTQHKLIQPFDRIIFFGNNGKHGLDQVAAAQSLGWKKPNLLLCRQYESKISSAYVFRSIIQDYQGWHRGKEDRFVY